MSVTTTSAAATDPGASATEAAPPAWSAVLRAQARLLVRKKWKLAGLIAAGGALAAYLGLAETATNDLSQVIVGSPVYGLAWIVAIGWAASIWSDEGPGDRAYHWSLPVAGPAHDLTRVGLGGVYYLAVGFLGLAAGTVLFVFFAGRPVLGGAGVWGLTALGLTVGFLLGTVPALLTAHPLRWTAGTALGYLILGGLLGEAADRWTWLAGLEGGVKSVWNGTLGLESAIAAPMQVGGFADEMVSTRPVAALLLWLGLAAAAVVGVSLLHVERAKGAAE